MNDNPTRRAALLGLAAATLGSPYPVAAQGFAGLGQTADGFALPDPAYRMHFPADHGPHPDFRIEWWYLTATLHTADAMPCGVQWTLFRTALAAGEADGWHSPQLWMAHAAVTTPTRHLFAEKLARGGIGQAGAQASPFTAWIDDWHMTAKKPAQPHISGHDALDALVVHAGSAHFGYDLHLTAQGPLIAHGQAGHSVKSGAGQASHYYSQPFYRVEGRLQIGGAEMAVSGDGWLDREWSSQPLAPDQTGWDWFALVLADGTRLMAFGLRDGGAGYTSGTWITPDGQATALANGALSLAALAHSRVADRQIPTQWRLRVPARGMDVVVTALNLQAFNATIVPYWEGPVDLTGSHLGRGYLEMTGYD